MNSNVHTACPYAYRSAIYHFINQRNLSKYRREIRLKFLLPNFRSLISFMHFNSNDVMKWNESNTMPHGRMEYFFQKNNSIFVSMRLQWQFHILYQWRHDNISPLNWNRILSAEHQIHECARVSVCLYALMCVENERSSNRIVCRRRRRRMGKKKIEIKKPKRNPKWIWKVWKNLFNRRNYSTIKINRLNRHPIRGRIEFRKIGNHNTHVHIHTELNQKLKTYYGTNERYWVQSFADNQWHTIVSVQNSPYAARISSFSFRLFALCVCHVSVCVWLQT